MDRLEGVGRLNRKAGASQTYSSTCLGRGNMKNEEVEGQLGAKVLNDVSKKWEIYIRKK